MDKFFEGDTVEIITDTDFDELDSATLIEYVVTKPSGVSDTWTAAQVDVDDAKYEAAGLTVTDQDITYTTIKDTDLDEIGIYQAQAHVTWGAGGELHGPIFKFKVKEHLTEPSP
jgi:hypothetical protein